MKKIVKRIITGITLGVLFWSAMILFPPIFSSCVLGLILVQIIFFEWKNLFDWHNPTFWLLMPLYPILPFTLLIILNHTPEYRHLLLYLFVIVSSLDTGAYIIGNIFGNHKIYPLVSPGKTWEGFIGGYIIACISLSTLLWEQGSSAARWIIILFTLIVCILSLCGDLFESLLKRHAQVKDSGTILPGHGGFLDRFDGILFAAFFFFFFKEYIAAIL